VATRKLQSVNEPGVTRREGHSTGLEIGFCFTFLRTTPDSSKRRNGYANPQLKAQHRDFQIMRTIIALLAVLQAATASAPVASFDPETDFSHYRSYKWVFHSPPAGMDQNLYRHIRFAVDRSLAAHGFVRSDEGEFAVAFTLGPREQVHPSDYGHYAPYYSGDQAAAHSKWVNQELAGLGIQQHTLAIDIYDSYSKHPVWHGLAPVPIAPATRTAIVEHEVDDVLRLFPPKGACGANREGSCAH
jgi:Domain of unknown function (DUF4136)